MYPNTVKLGCVARHIHLLLCVIICYYIVCKSYLIGWVKRRSRASQWTIADGLAFALKDDVEACHHNVDPP